MYVPGNFIVNEDGYLDFVNNFSELQVQNVPDYIEVKTLDGLEWKDGYIIYDPRNNKYYIHKSINSMTKRIPLDFKKVYHVKLSTILMLYAHRDDCRARDKIAYADGSYGMYRRKVND